MTSQYAASRTLLALSLEGKAPKIFRKCTPGGLPIWSVAFTSSLGLLAFMGTSSSGTAGEIFNWLYNLSASTGLIAWVVSRRLAFPLVWRGADGQLCLPGHSRILLAILLRLQSPGYRQEGIPLRRSSSTLLDLVSARALT